MRSTIKFLPLFLALIMTFAISGVFAAWQYTNESIETVDSLVSCTMNEFRYGTLYITKISITGGTYNRAQTAQISDLNMQADLTLNPQSDSSVTVEVTLYNNTSNSFYYNKTEAVSWNNNAIGYTVTGIEKQDEIPGYSYKTIQVTFAYTGNNVSASSLLGELHFNFVVDKDSIGDIVALTAVDRFKAILNNEVAVNSYQILENAMNNRSGWNKESAVTYIGNVAGSSDTDSKVIKELFGEEFMSMDLDGDGKAEPITIMIKRENLDSNAHTGDSYTYTSWGRDYTVNGAEMTLYITSANLNNVSNNQSVIVYAAALTKLPNAEKWTDLVLLTKGKANANNYSGYGSANSFNTDTWVSDTGKSMEELVAS